MMIYAFEDYELDLPRYALRHAGKPIRLEPQVFNVLAYLIQHRERVVTKEELLERLWPGRFVGEATLTSRLTAARRAIGDRGREQRLIQTLHGRGYRFVAAVEERATDGPGGMQHPSPPIASEVSVLSASSTPAAFSSRWSVPLSAPVPPPISATVGEPDASGLTRTAPRGLQAVGRGAELAQLQRWWQRALDGNRQIVFITGEAGLGKTTLVETFISELCDHEEVWVGRGQCIEHYGAGEAYLPVLEALSGLCKGPRGAELITLLVRQAPTWVMQMPWLISGAELEVLERRVIGATQDRMLREMAEALTIVAAQRPLILVLEDLHWSDYATLNLLAWLARQREPARLLVLGTYRPAEVRLQDHPLQAVVRELSLHRYSQELTLALLDEEAITQYLMARFPGIALPKEVVHLLHQRTEGNPLFMVNVVDAWEAEGWLQERQGQLGLQKGLDELAQGVPESLQQMLAQQLDRLSVEEQRILEAASVAGVEFSAAAVAAGLEIDVIDAENQCEQLARRQQWLRAVGSDEWPDGTVAGRYTFIHAFYHDVVYRRITAARHIHLHRRIGMAKMGAYGARASEIAAELAVHFFHGRDYGLAVQYLRQAAETAIQRHAHRNAVEHLKRALELLPAISDRTAALRQELAIQLALGPALMVSRGFAAPEVEETYARARQLCEQLSDQQQLFAALFGLWRFAHVRARLTSARGIGEELLALAMRQADPVLLIDAHAALGQTLCIQGELGLARQHLHQVTACHPPPGRTTLAFRFGYDPGVYARAVEGWVLWLLGYPEQALQRNHEALQLAREQSHPFTLALTLATGAVLQQLLRDEVTTLEYVSECIALSREHGFPYLRTIAMIRQGWGLVRTGRLEEGLGQMRQGLDSLRTTGTGLLRPYHLALLAEACGSCGQIEVGLAALEEALIMAAEHVERFYEAELHRVKGELLRKSVVGRVSRSTSEPEAEACFLQALDLARRQGARSLELRAALSLARLWQQQGKRGEARQLLTDVSDWFSEGFGTSDLRDAKALLAELA